MHGTAAVFARVHTWFENIFRRTFGSGDGGGGTQATSGQTIEEVTVAAAGTGCGNVVDSYEHAQLLQQGEACSVTVPLDGRAFAYYDTKSRKWRADAGTYAVLVGRSSERIEPTGEA
jgi:hypothetical protein